MKLKTLKDFGRKAFIQGNVISFGVLKYKSVFFDAKEVIVFDREELKEEAIKWRKEIIDKWDKMKDTPEAFAVWVLWFISYIYDIKEEDLK